MKFVFGILALICGALALPLDDGPKCEAPGGGGLMPVLREFVALIPVDQLLERYFEAVSEDEEVQQVMEYISSDDFIKVIVAIHNAPEYDALIKIACDDLYLDATYYLDIIGGILGWPQKPKPKMLSLADKRPGVHGLLLDCMDMLPIEKFKEMVKEKYETDEYVRQGIELLRSDTFKSIVKKVQSLEQYKHMVEELKGMGVDVDLILEWLKNYLGWDLV